MPVHRRTIEVEVFEDDEQFSVVAHLKDERPWARDTEAVADVHRMALEVEVRREDLVITKAEAHMHTFPHAECPQIAPAFAGLVGLSVTRGYNRAVQERFGRAKGCTHLEFMARAVGPVVLQAIPSSALRHPPEQGSDGVSASGLTWLGDTCHVWAHEGPGQEKVALGWRPGQGAYPAPSAAELRAKRGTQNPKG